MDKVFFVAKDKVEIDWEELAFDTPERIFAEDGNRRYRSVNDCLMEKESGMLAAACISTSTARAPVTWAGQSSSAPSTPSTP